jgi:flagellar biosynthesis protein FlhA
MPKVRIRDNLRLAQRQYRIKIADLSVAEGELQPARLLAVDTGNSHGAVEGLATREPSRGLPAVWIEPSLRSRAESLGYQIVEPVAVLVGHLSDVVRAHGDELLTRDATKHLVDELRKSSPAVVDELIPGQLKLSEVQQVLQLLLREQVSIRQLGQILEALGEHAHEGKDPVALAETVRRRLARTICARHREPRGPLYVVTLDPDWEESVRGAIDPGPRGPRVRLAPAAIEDLCRSIEEALRRGGPPGRAAVLLVSPELRLAIKQVTGARMPRLAVLSYDEITADTPIESLGMVERPTTVGEA